MSFTFRDKKIWLFSPEPWSDMKLSKHHYAETLSANGAIVYFIEPKSTSSKIEVEALDGTVFRVNYPMLAKGWGKLPGWLYKTLVKIEIARLQKCIGKPDIIWTYNPYKLTHMSVAKAPVKIYHPVDQFDPKFLKQYTFKFDIAFSTMHKEVEGLRQLNVPAHFIQHGLAPSMEKLCRERLLALENGWWANLSKDGKCHIGFAGNLWGDAPDRDAMRQIIEEFNDCHFHFWGNFNSVLHDALINEKQNFVTFLQHQPNVTLYGAVSKKQLAEAMQKMNMFWVLWKKSDSPIWNKYTNPHKILEYLSMGVPVMTHYMDHYKDHPFVFMVNEQHSNSKEVFQKALAASKDVSFKTEAIAQMKYALENTYQHQLERIAQIISRELHVG